MVANHGLLSPYRPPADGPWGRRQAAHLLRRAGFRANEETIQRTIQDGPAETIERLTHTQPEPERYREIDSLGDRLALRDDVSSLAGWWLAKMVHTANPLAARLSVFWHNHFATSNIKVRSPAMMLGQLRSIERHAMGRFDALLLAMARDPAMIVWLDGDSNNKGRPNENFARELLELFTLGVGNYTERDIKDAARAFTGWHQRRGRFAFDRGDHDEGRKTILGQSGEYDGDEVIALILAQRAAGAFLARKLVREFISDEPSEALVSEMAEVLTTNRYVMAAALRVLLGSRAMFAPNAYRARIASPVEFVVGTARALRMRLDMPAAARAAGEMGQRLFEPPSVKGWDGGRTWINSATMLVRMNAAAAACRGRDDGVGLDVRGFAARYPIEGGDAVVRFVSELLLDGQVPPALVGQLRAAAIGANDAPGRLRAVVQLVVGSPEYQFV